MYWCVWHMCVKVRKKNLFIHQIVGLFKRSVNVLIQLKIDNVFRLNWFFFLKSRKRQVASIATSYAKQYLLFVYPVQILTFYFIQMRLCSQDIWRRKCCTSEHPLSSKRHCLVSLALLDEKRKINLKSIKMWCVLCILCAQNSRKKMPHEWETSK